MLGQSITRNSVLLALFALCTTALIAGTFLSTEEQIAQAQRLAEEKALLEIVPRERHDNSMLDDVVELDASATGLGLRKVKKAYRARSAGEVVAVILPATAADGYSGDIDLIVGVNLDGSLAGVRVLAHKETPGLGDKVDLNKSDWVLSFAGRSLSDPAPEQWGVKKDRGYFDQFTGATITPRAVVAAVKRSLEYAQAERVSLFELPPEGAN